MRLSSLGAKVAAAYLLLAGLGSAQLLQVGIKGGVPLTDAFSSSTGASLIAPSNSKEFVIGPTAELRLPVVGLGVEADALYRPVSYSAFKGKNVVSTSSASWQFPILAKYRFGPPLVKPYAEAGPVFRAAGSDLSTLSHAGFALGAGVEVGLLRLHVSPEIRYLRWASDSGKNAPLGILRSNQNEAQFLIGLTF